MFTLIALLPLVLHAVAAVAAATCAQALGSTPLGPLAWAAAPAVYVLTLLALAIAAARPVVGKIRPGRFRRTPQDRDYLARRLYGAAWTSLYYCKPVLAFLLGVPLLRTAMLRGFGYRGSARITLYPDSWTRDLALLDFGDDVYIANRATLGTNVVSGDRIVVGGIRLGARTVIGHLAIVGGGLVTGEDVEVGPGAAVGFQTSLGDGVRIGGRAVVGHRTRIGDGTCLGLGVHVGERCRIGANLRVPDGAVIPAGSRLSTQAEVDALVDEPWRRAAEANRPVIVDAASPRVAALNLSA